MHPDFVLICDSKYLRVCELGASYVLGMEVLVAGGAAYVGLPPRGSDTGAREADSSCMLREISQLITVISIRSVRKQDFKTSSA